MDRANWEDAKIICHQALRFPHKVVEARNTDNIAKFKVRRRNMIMTISDLVIGKTKTNKVGSVLFAHSPLGVQVKLYTN